MYIYLFLHIEDWTQVTASLRLFSKSICHLELFGKSEGSMQPFKCKILGAEESYVGVLQGTGRLQDRVVQWCAPGLGPAV